MATHTITLSFQEIQEISQMHSTDTLEICGIDLDIVKDQKTLEDFMAYLTDTVTQYATSFPKVIIHEFAELAPEQKAFYLDLFRAFLPIFSVSSTTIKVIISTPELRNWLQEINTNKKIRIFSLEQLFKKKEKRERDEDNDEEASKPPKRRISFASHPQVSASPAPVAEAENNEPINHEQNLSSLQTAGEKLFYAIYHGLQEEERQLIENAENFPADKMFQDLVEIRKQLPQRQLSLMIRGEYIGLLPTLLESSEGIDVNEDPNLIPDLNADPSQNLIIHSNGNLLVVNNEVSIEERYEAHKKAIEALISKGLHKSNVLDINGLLSFSLEIEILGVYPQLFNFLVDYINDNLEEFNSLLSQDSEVAASHLARAAEHCSHTNAFKKLLKIFPNAADGYSHDSQIFSEEYDHATDSWITPILEAIVHGNYEYVQQLLPTYIKQDDEGTYISPKILDGNPLFRTLCHEDLPEEIPEDDLELNLATLGIEGAITLSQCYLIIWCQLLWFLKDFPTAWEKLDICLIPLIFFCLIKFPKDNWNLETLLEYYQPCWEKLAEYRENDPSLVESLVKEAMETAAEEDEESEWKKQIHFKFNLSLQLSYEYLWDLNRQFGSSIDTTTLDWQQNIIHSEAPLTPLNSEGGIGSAAPSVTDRSDAATFGESTIAAPLPMTEGAKEETLQHSSLSDVNLFKFLGEFSTTPPAVSLERAPGSVVSALQRFGMQYSPEAEAPPTLTRLVPPLPINPPIL